MKCPTIFDRLLINLSCRFLLLEKWCVRIQCIFCVPLRVVVILTLLGSLTTETVNQPCVYHSVCDHYPARVLTCHSFSPQT